MTTPTLDTANLNSSVLQYFESKGNIVFKKKVQELIEAYLHNDIINAELSLEELIPKFGFTTIPQNGHALGTFIEELEEQLLPHSINTGSPYFIGHMTSLLPSFIRPLSELLTTLNQNIVKVETAKIATLYEKQALAMMHQEIFGLSEDYYKQYISQTNTCLGMVCSGGTLANVAAMQCARNNSLQGSVDIEQYGFSEALFKSGFTRSVIICSQLGHYSLSKSLGLLGMGRKNLISIKTNDRQQVDLIELKAELLRCKAENIHVTAIVGIAGATECGSFDPLEDMADLAEEFGTHFHVDAAWGGAVLFSGTHRHLLKGIERADSVTIDGHKQLYLPMGIGMVLFKTPDTAKSITTQADYIIRKNSYDLGRVSIEGSRPANILYLQAAFKLLGKDGYRELVDNSISTASRMAEVIEKSDDFELLTRPQSNIFLYRYIPTAYRQLKFLDRDANEEISNFNIQLQEKQKMAGLFFVSRTLFKPLDQPLGSISALRVVLANPLTKLEHCLKVLEDQRTIAKSCSIEYKNI
ncbi:MAG: aminotransferase class V-fold PLP-dependent enzyme [Lentisphaeraceae bacterium]|nr:aminotransferase class V-fold PLP-dependent enzyme [Lentisphaeraceae bacterium]